MHSAKRLWLIRLIIHRSDRLCILQIFLNPQTTSMLLIKRFRHNGIKENERSVETDLVPWIKKGDVIETVLIDTLID